MSVMTDPAPHGTQFWAPARLQEDHPEQVAQFRVSLTGLSRSDTPQVIPSRVVLAGGVLRRPIWLEVTAVEGGGVGVVHPGTGIFGYGANLTDAVTDLRAALVEHRDVLKELEEAVPGNRDQLEQLEQLLITA